MYKGKSIAVVVPAYNEEKLIGKVIETIPDYVDYVVIVDDLSQDHTIDVVNSYLEKSDGRVVLIALKKNSGVGGAIAEGYKWCREHQIGATAVMAGDAQMDPADLPSLLDPVVDGEVDYTKGNRLFTGEAWHKIPKARYMGNAVLSLLTKIASGYWHVADSQTGFTVANDKVLSTLDLGGIYKRYGMPNDMLVKLNIAGCTIREVPIKPVYRVGENSKMKVRKVIPKIFCLLLRSFIKRLWIKYFINDFHPLFILYNLSLLLYLLCLPFAMRIIHYLAGGVTGDKPVLNALMFMFLFVSASQSLLFAMWMDIQDNERLYR